MKRITAFIVLLITGCAAPKHYYYFDHYTVTPGANSKVSGPSESTPSPLDIRTADLAANANGAEPKIDAGQKVVADQKVVDLDKLTVDTNEHFAIRQTQDSHEVVINSDEQYSKHLSNERVSKHTLRENRKELISALKQLRKDLRNKTNLKSNAPLHDEATQKLDNELIVAISFAAVGITLSILGGLGAWFWIAGVICLGVGVYFFIDWLRKR
ncbi:hypothetical protein WBG78_23780 [Chryseolinea sp. T2]|uniref:hypothetical protein n=1 Tax=Chryseolinea sp. T2 TaxID=3129255 RepID=UPI003077FEDD